jgi:folate-binding protein YgfZ
VSDNLAPVFNGFRMLAQPQVLRLAGPDAIPFAQAQFANDVVALDDGHWQWNAWLTAKGRVAAAFQLLRVDAQQLLLVCHDGGAEAMAEQLRRFVFRRKVTLTTEAPPCVSGAFQAPAQATGAQIAQLEGGVLELDVGTPQLPRSLRLGAASGDQQASATEELAWRQSDLRLGLPRLIDTQREQWTPQQLGLDRLNAYSVRKGCYPGQEIVARTHFLGKAKRSLALLHTAAAPSPGDSVSAKDASVGTVVSCAGALALAVLPLELPPAALRINGEDAARLELLDGLAR